MEEPSVKHEGDKGKDRERNTRRTAVVKSQGGLGRSAEKAMAPHSSTFA